MTWTYLECKPEDAASTPGRDVISLHHANHGGTAVSGQLAWVKMAEKGLARIIAAARAAAASR